MTSNKTISIFLLITFSLTGCLFDSHTDRVTGKYIILWIDLPKNQTLSEEIKLHSSGSTPILPPYIFAVGHNEHFIIAKQHPTNGFEGGYKIHTDTTNYFIIDINQANNKVFGPLTLQKFNRLKCKLKIQDLSFDQIYPEDP